MDTPHNQLCANVSDLLSCVLFVGVGVRINQEFAATDLTGIFFLLLTAVENGVSYP